MLLLLAVSVNADAQPFITDVNNFRTFNATYGALTASASIHPPMVFGNIDSVCNYLEQLYGLIGAAGNLQMVTAAGNSTTLDMYSGSGTAGSPGAGTLISAVNAGIFWFSGGVNMGNMLTTSGKLKLVIRDPSSGFYDVVTTGALSGPRAQLFPDEGDGTGLKSTLVTHTTINPITIGSSVTNVTTSTNSIQIEQSSVPYFYVGRDTSANSVVPSVIMSMYSSLHGISDTLHPDTSSASNNLWFPAATGTLAAFTNPIAVKNSSYTAVPYNLIPVDATSGNVPITLPTAPPDKTTEIIKVVALGSSHTVTISAGGSDVFNKAGGSTTLTLSNALQMVYLQYSKATGIWYDITQPALVTPINAVTLTNKRITARDSSVSNISAVTWNTDKFDGGTIAIDGAMTINVTGTPTIKQVFTMEIWDDGTPHALTFGASIIFGSTVSAPTSTVGNSLKPLTIELVALNDGKFHAQGVNQE